MSTMEGTLSTYAARQWRASLAGRYHGVCPHAALASRGLPGWPTALISHTRRREFVRLLSDGAGCVRYSEALDQAQWIRQSAIR